MTVLIVFATVEGQTGKIVRFIEEEVRSDGCHVALFDTANRAAPVSFDGVDKVILAAPVHERRHPETFEVFITAHGPSLAGRETLLLSVSLSAAFPAGMEDAEDYVREMEMRTGFTPTETALVAGAVRSDCYDYFAQQVLRHVVLRGRDYDPGQGSHEFTDWPALSRTVSDFLTAEEELTLS
jgi:menaquinone-dependent protoporphyrinogen oxidase